MVGGQGFHLFVLHLWQGAALRWIPAHQCLLDGEVVRRADHLVDVADGLWSQTFRLFLGFNAVNPATVQQVFVEPLQVQRGQVCQRDAADLRLDVILEEALTGLERGRSEFHSGVVFHPDFQPCSHRVGLGPSVVDADVFLDGFFQFFFDFCLRFSQHILDDGLACLWIVTDCVPPLPASILSFSDIALAVCSSLWHDISPFRNEQYRNQGNKATRKSNCYQKVIICPSEPCRLIFAYCGAISALPGDVLLLLQRCDFWTVESLFSLTTAAQNIHIFLRKSPLCRNHFFGWSKTANSSTACGTVTLKSLLPQAFFTPHVHPRLRKCLSRCTLDCGFKTSESPALRGFEGGPWALATAALYLC